MVDDPDDDPVPPTASIASDFASTVPCCAQADSLLAFFFLFSFLLPVLFFIHYFIIIDSVKSAV